MPEIHLTCHACGAKLRLGNPALVGKKIKCPKCAAVCQVPRAAEPEEEAIVEAAPAPVRKRPPAPVAAGPAPRKKPRPEDDDEEQDAPRPRKGAKQKASRSPNWLLIGIGGGAALILVVVGVLWGVGVFDGKQPALISKGPGPGGKPGPIDPGPIDPGPINPGPGDGGNPDGPWPLKPLTHAELADRGKQREANYLARRAEEVKEVAQLRQAAGPGRPLLVWEWPKGLIFLDSLVFSPDGTMLAAQSSKKIEVWDLKTRKQLWSQEAPSSMGPNGLRFSHDSKLLASTAMRPKVNVYDARTGTIRATVGGHSGGVAAVAFKPDGKTLVSAGTGEYGPDIEVKLWDLQKPGQAATLPPRVGKARQFTLSDDGRLLLYVGTHNKAIEIRDLYSNEVVCSAPADDGPYNVSFAPDGVHFAYRRVRDKGDRNMYIVDMVARKSLLGIRPPEFALNPGWAFAPSCKTLLFWRRSGEGSLWEVADDGKKLQDIRHEGLVPPVAFSPGGEMVAAAAPGSSGAILVWAAADVFGKAPAQP